MKLKNAFMLLFYFTLILMFFIQSCTEKYSPATLVESTGDGSNCVSCHRNKELLKQVASPLPPPGESSGEG